MKPYGANDEMKKLAERSGLRYSPNGFCLHWLSKGRCGVDVCFEGRHGHWDWMDHASGWIDSDGKRLLLCQPYQIHDVQSLVAACNKFGLEYGHGTVAIELRKAT
jgi:hypothetical protein